MRCTWSLALAVVLAGATARADEDPAAAEALFLEGRRLFAERRFAEACPKFAASQKLAPAPGTLLNEADCWEAAGRTATAWALFREAIDLSRQVKRPDREKFARDRADELEPKLARITIALAAGATKDVVVRRDGKELDPAELGVAIPVDPGEHAIEVTAPGRTAFRMVLRIEGGGREVVTVPPLGVPAAPPAPAPPACASCEASRREVASRGPAAPFYVSAGLALAGVVAGSAFGLAARSTWNEARDGPHCRGAVCDPVGADAVHDARMLGNVATLSFVVAGAALASAAYFFLSRPRASATAHGVFRGLATP